MSYTTTQIRAPALVHGSTDSSYLADQHLGSTVGAGFGNNNPMNENGKLQGKEAIDKFKELVNHQSVCMFLTDTPNWPEAARPMSTQKVCDEGNFWFLSVRSSNKNKAIALDPKVHLLYVNTSASEYLSVAGTAEIIDDMAKKKELWNPIAGAWFPEGVEDPELTVLKVKPTDGYYWDTKSGTLLSTIMIMAAAVTGKASDDGIEGTIRVAHV